MWLLIILVSVVVLLFFFYGIKANASSSSSFSTHPSSLLPKCQHGHDKQKNDVFVSFRGEDTRDNFTSHLYAALSRKKFITFIDKELERGQEISPSLLKAIEESKLSVVIFSKNYAFSTWCLDELEKILECNKMNGQIVVPVFYKVCPSQVRNQTDSFADAFAKHEENFRENMDKVENWRAALKEVANLSGWDSTAIRPEAKLIDEIIKDIMKKLNKISPTPYVDDLIGIDSRIKQVESLLCLESLDVRIIGLWGMGGIGKTTVAGVVFNRICTQFEGLHFLASVREELKRSTISQLRDRLLSKLLEDDINTGIPSFEHSFNKDLLHRKKVLIVLDDVDDSTQLQQLLGGRNFLGPGSRILVTSRDKQVLKNIADAIYEVEGLNIFESFQLFSLNAFKDYKPADDLIDMSKRVINYAKGNPLALIVLGSALFDRTKADWNSALNGLAKVPNPKVQNVLRISYDGLDHEEQKVFLDVACFFKGKNREFVEAILDGCYFSVHYNISTLVDKSLIKISHNKIEMHDLVQEMAWAIVREESIVEPGKRSRLQEPEEIYHVLTKNKGTEAIEGIFLDISKTREMHLESNAFERMDNLRLLKFYAPNSSMSYKKMVFLPWRGLQSLSDKLRYLHWHGFPSKSLPSKFCAENLVVLNLPYSNVKQLWKGVQHLGNLKSISLLHSIYLISIPDLSEAKNIETINLEGCKSLVEIPSCIQYLNKLEYLNLRDCKNLRSLPSNLDSNFLKKLDFSYCSHLKKCPEIVGNVEDLHWCGTGIKEVPQSIQKLKALEVIWLNSCSNITKFPEISRNIRELHVSKTSIKEVPSSIECLTALTMLEMTSCNKLSSLPSSICKLKSLEFLVLSHCSKLETFPEILEPMEGLACLYLDYCENLKRLPSSIYNLKSLEHLHLSGTAIQELPSSIGKLICLEEVKLDNCTKLRSLPNSIHKLSQLRSIYVSYCKSLTYLPELPPSLKVLEAKECKCFETLSRSGICNFMNLSFSNCFELDQKACCEILGDSDQSTVHQLMADKFCKYEDQVRILFNGSEIPQCFHAQSMGWSVTLQLPSNWYQSNGISFCIVFASKDPSIEVRISRLRCQCLIQSYNHEDDDAICNWVCYVDDLHLGESDQVLLWYDQTQSMITTLKCGVANEEEWFGRYSTATFKFYPQMWRKLQKHRKVKKCGVILL